jgi:hypothetical protein
MVKKHYITNGHRAKPRELKALKSHTKEHMLNLEAVSPKRSFWHSCSDVLWRHDYIDRTATTRLYEYLAVGAHRSPIPSCCW